MCKFFDSNNCHRFPACPFAHGQDELDKITQVKGFGADITRPSRRASETFRRFRGDPAWKIAQPGDWYCPGCNDLQFARKLTCRRCGCFKDAPGVSVVGG